MRILHLSSELPPTKVFGLGRFVHGLSRAQVAQGDRVQVLTNSVGGAEDDVVIAGVEIHRIAFPNPPRPPDGHAEVLQFNYCLVSRFFERRERFRDVDVVVGHDWLTALAAREIARDLEKPLVTTFHDEIVGKRFGVLDPESRFIFEMEKLAISDSTRVLANSAFIASQLARNAGADPGRVDVAYGGVDRVIAAAPSDDGVAKLRALVAPDQGVTVGYVGRLDPEKGLDLLLRAFADVAEKVPRAQLLLAGSGKLDQSAQAILDSLRPRARLLGYLRGEALACFYRACDLIVVPSRYEPLGLVPLEAMIAGTAVLVSSAGGLAEIVRPDRDGAVFPAGDADALASGLLEILRSSELRARLAQGGRERADSTFSWRNAATEARACYQRAVAGYVSATAAVRADPGQRERARNITASLPVSIVMVAYNGLDVTRRGVEAVLANTAPPFELILVDNGSSDGTRDLFRSLKDGVRAGVLVTVLENGENLGYPKAVNQASRAAKGRDLVLLNNDTEVQPGWLAALIEGKRRTEDVGIVTAKILHKDGTVQSAGGVQHHADGRFTIPFAGEPRHSPSGREPREVDNAGGPCMLVTREVLDQVGLFDERFSPGYFEDSDLCMRARKAGFRLTYEPGSEVVHLGKATANLVAREGKIDIWKRFEENKRLFYERWKDQLAADDGRRRSRTVHLEVGSPPGARQRILLCYNKNAHTTAAYCERALRRDHDVVTCGRGHEIDLGERASAADLVHAAGGADLLLVVEGENYFPRAIEACPCPTAFWAIDNHIHAVDDSGWHFAAANAFDHVFIAQRDYVPTFAARGRPVHWLPLACDPALHDVPATHRDLDIVFVGHVRPFHTRRRRLLDRLARRFSMVERQGVFGEEMTRLLSRAKIVFNCSLAGDLNMRVFEGLASGALLVTDRVANGFSRIFTDGEHVALYDDETLEAVVQRYIDDRTARETIALQGRLLAVTHHTYAHRMRALVGAVGSRMPRPVGAMT